MPSVPACSCRIACFLPLKAIHTDITTNKILVETMPTRMVFDPKSADVAVATNLHSDKLRDLAAR